jgi:flagellar biogenesis protein FliO
MPQNTIFASIYTDNILKSLEIFWKGLLAVFVVIALIILATYALKRAVEYSERRKAAKLTPSNDAQDGQEE